jgi:hypothetical protein
MRGYRLKMGSQIGAALLHLVAQFAARKGGEGGIAELLPGGAQPFLQGADIVIQDYGLVHATESPDVICLQK